MSPFSVQSHWLGSDQLLESQGDQENLDLKNHFQDAVQDLLEVPGRVSLNWLQLMNWKTKTRVSYAIINASCNYSCILSSDPLTRFRASVRRSISRSISKRSTRRRSTGISSSRRYEFRDGQKEEHDMTSEVGIDH